MEVILDTQIELQAPAKSNFVTVLAWIFIVLSGFATLIGVLQNIMVQTMFADPKFKESLSKLPSDVPASAAFMASNIRLMFAIALGVFATTLVSSIGLLNRRNWARLMFIGIMGIGILWNIGGLVFQLIMFSSFPPTAAFQSFFVGMMIFGACLAIAISVLFGWVIMRLVSKPIAAEFTK